MNTTLISLTVQLEHTRLTMSELKDTTKLLHTMFSKHETRISKLESLVDHRHGGDK